MDRSPYLENLGQLSERLVSIYGKVNPNAYVADIGADHGFLAIALSDKCSHVYAIEISKDAFDVMKKNIDLFKASSCLHESKISPHLGNGITPLVTNNVECDTIILSGMGSGTILKILEKQFDINGSNVVNNILGIKSVITQPWPPNFLSAHKVNKLLLEKSWMITSQSICENKSNRFITTKFDFSPHLNCNNQLLSDSEVIESSPLYQFALKDPKSNEIYLNYLRKEKITIDIKINGILKFSTSKLDLDNLMILQNIKSSIDKIITE